MTDKEKRQQRRSAEDAVFNRMLLCLVGAIIAEAVVLFVKRFYVDTTASDFDISMAVALTNIFSVLAVAGLVLTVAGVIWCVAAKKKDKSMALPVVLTVVAAFLWVLSVLARVLNDTGIKIMMVLPIVAAVLILIYFLYHRAFFINAVLSGCGMAVLWCFRQFYAGHPAVSIALVILFWVCLAVIVILAAVTKKNGGKLGKLRLVNDQKSYVPCWLTCAVAFVTTLLALILGVGIAYYLIYVLIGWLFCLAVYYTVKLM